MQKEFNEKIYFTSISIKITCNCSQLTRLYVIVFLRRNKYMFSFGMFLGFDNLSYSCDSFSHMTFIFKIIALLFFYLTMVYKNCVDQFSIKNITNFYKEFFLFQIPTLIFLTSSRIVRSHPFILRVLFRLLDLLN